MNTTRQEIYLVIVHGRLDPQYAFTNREDAEAFVRAVQGDDPLSEHVTIDALPLISGGGAGELIAQERES